MNRSTDHADSYSAPWPHIPAVERNGEQKSAVDRRRVPQSDSIEHSTRSCATLGRLEYPDEIYIADPAPQCGAVNRAVLMPEAPWKANSRRYRAIHHLGIFEQPRQHAA